MQIRSTGGFCCRPTICKRSPSLQWTNQTKDEWFKRQHKFQTLLKQNAERLRFAGEWENDYSSFFKPQKFLPYLHLPNERRMKGQQRKQQKKDEWWKWRRQRKEKEQKFITRAMVSEHQKIRICGGVWEYTNSHFWCCQNILF